MKTLNKLVVISVACALPLLSPSAFATTVAHVETTNVAQGRFLSSAGAALAVGGVSVGYFTVAIPTPLEWLEISSQAIVSGIASAYGRLAGAEFGFVDVRSFLGQGAPPASLGANFDWDFAPPNPAPPTVISGSVLDLGLPVLPGNTQLFVMGFNAGTWNANVGLSFLSATEWAVVAASNWITPASGIGTVSTLLVNVDTVAEVKIGTDPGDGNVRLAAVPEPSAAILLSAGMLGLFTLRRRASRA